MSDCIFCKIIEGNIPASVIYEDDQALAFMDIGPIIKGHALVIPKKHYETITQIPDELLMHLHAVAKRIAQAQQDALNADGVNIMQNNGTVAGQEVPHFHIHIIPRFAEDGHHWNWHPKKYADLEEMNLLAKKLQHSIQE